VHGAPESLLARGPGSLVHRRERNGWGPSGCTKCGWRGVPRAKAEPPRRGTTRRNLRVAAPNVTSAEGLDNRCPACELGAETQADWNELTRPRRAEAKPGRNDPCDCGSGKKAKRCCHR
jgi:hypothetical protein